jgi:putative transposase
MLEPTNSQLTLKVQAELLGISYSSLFYQPVPASPREVAIKNWIDRIYTEHPYYGSRRITVVLNQEMAVSRPTVQSIKDSCGAAISKSPML